MLGRDSFTSLSLSLKATFFLILLFPSGVWSEVFNPSSFTLKNGLQVFIVSQKRSPVVNHSLWFKVGAADDPLGKSGLAHFLEHLRIKGGAKTYKPLEFPKKIMRMGGEGNAYTTHDYTYYTFQVSKDNLEKLMALESDRFENLQITDDLMESERRVILEERRMTIETNPFDQLNESAMAAFYTHHPYGTPILGWKNEIEKITKADTVNFLKKWYMPSNAVLTLVGDITLEEAQTLAEKYYGHLPKDSKPERRWVKEPIHHGTTQEVVLKSPSSPGILFEVFYDAPNLKSVPAKDAYALQIFSKILTGSSNAELYKALIKNQKLAQWVSSRYSPGLRSPSPFRISIGAIWAHELPKLESTLQAELSRIITQGVTHEAVERAKQILLRSVVYEKESLADISENIGLTIMSERSIQSLESWPENIKNVTRHDVNSVIRKVFGSPPRIVAKGLKSSEPSGTLE
ncbi:MAG: insulinase family protein [Alphaproteobacteria bacterium]|jgi:zinc protease|nr:insulinase family protein [Alphaproteobacteria bacterium]MBT5389372.1 insulinase family protein [Alphaproteobacteria bacterium]MBT5654321.1 insulinase family protein [Alphaproteobacteria bacterium]